MARVKCILGYYDTKLNRHVNVDEEFNVAEDRAKQLIKAKVAKEVTTPTTEKVAKKSRAKKEA